MRFIEYLSEGRSISITEKEANKLLKSKDYYDSTYGTPIYRGLENMKERFLFVRPSKFQRQSANTDNYYTLLIDNSERWKKFPKRSKSLICSTDIDYASEYGTVYRVIPKVGSKIGVCSKQDIWDSFKVYLPLVNDLINKLIDEKNVSNIHYINDYYDLGDLFLDYDIWRTDISIDIMAHMEDDIDEKELVREILNDLFNDSNYLLSQFIEHLIDGKKTIDFFEDILDPNKNNFELVKAGNHKIPKEREVWTDGDCLLISEEQNEII